MSVRITWNVLTLAIEIGNFLKDVEHRELRQVCELLFREFPVSWNAVPLLKTCPATARRCVLRVVDSVGIGGCLARRLTPLQRMKRAPHCLLDAMTHRVEQLRPSFATSVVLSVLGQGEVPEVVTDEFQLKSRHCVLGISYLSTMNALPIHEFNTAGTAPARRAFAALPLG
jgi:hypothetical protein